MLKTRTVFVVGAGANVKFDFPLGGQLKQEIATLTHIDIVYGRPSGGDPQIAAAALLSANNALPAIERLIKAGAQIARAMPAAVSIDTFLHSREGDADINLMGKLGIAKAILASERRSPLYVRTVHEAALSHSDTQSFAFDDNESSVFHNQPDSWLGKFAALVCQGFHAEHLDSLFENVSFVIFNYDRCVEHYLWHHLQQYFGISVDAASALLAKVNFHHPYGCVGALPWQTNTNFSVRFGHEPSAADLLKVATGIKTFTESVNGKNRGELLDDLGDAQRVIFLGFGFTPQNMTLLTLPASGLVENVYATALSMSNDSCAAIEDSVRDAFCVSSGHESRGLPEIRLHADLTVEKLFDHYSLRLSR